MIVLREWNLLLSSQKIALRRQSITRSDWEKLPWTGTSMLTLHKSLGDWTHVGTLPSRKKQ